jgi:hypothetical protein
MALCYHDLTKNKINNSIFSAAFHFLKEESVPELIKRFLAPFCLAAILAGIIAFLILCSVPSEVIIYERWTNQQLSSICGFKVMHRKGQHLTTRAMTIRECDQFVIGELVHYYYVDERIAKIPTR